MKRRKFIIIILILCIIITGCKDKEKEKDESESQSVPRALEQVQQQSDEIVTLTMAKDWAGSLEKAKELQSTWNELYPDIQKKGAKQEDVDAFVAGLNTLTDNLILKTLNLPQKPAGEEKKDEQSPEQEQDSEQASEEEKSGEQQSPGQEQTQGAESQGTEEEKKDEQSPEQEQNSEQESEGEKSGEQESGGQEQGTESQGAEEEKKDPKEILDEIDPLISASEEDLVIINSSVEITKYIPKFMSLFESPIPPDIFKLKYLVRHLHVASKLEDWDTASADLKSVKETWESVQAKVLETDEDLKTQLVQSIDELEDVINSENANLTGVKCNFIIEQIESLTKTIKEKEEQKQEE